MLCQTRSWPTIYSGLPTPNSRLSIVEVWPCRLHSNRKPRARSRARHRHAGGVFGLPSSKPRAAISLCGRPSSGVRSASIAPACHGGRSVCSPRCGWGWSICRAFLRRSPSTCSRGGANCGTRGDLTTAKTNRVAMIIVDRDLPECWYTKAGSTSLRRAEARGRARPDLGAGWRAEVPLSL